MDLEFEQKSSCGLGIELRERLCAIQRRLFADLDCVKAYVAALHELQDRDDAPLCAPQQVFSSAQRAASALVIRIETHIEQVDNALLALDESGAAPSCVIRVDEKAFADTQQGISMHLHFLQKTLPLLWDWTGIVAPITQGAETFCALAALLSSDDDEPVSPSPEEAFRAACKHGQLEAVLFLLHAFPRTNLNATNKKGVTALMLASWAGHLSIVRALLDIPLERGLVLDAVDTRKGETAVMHAAASGHDKVVNAFIELPEFRRPDVNARNVFGRTVADLQYSFRVSLKWVPPEMRTPELRLSTLSHELDTYAFQWVPPEMRIPEKCLAAVPQDMALRFVGPQEVL